MIEQGALPALVQSAAGAVIALSGIRFAGANTRQSHFWEHVGAVSMILTGCFVVWATLRSLSPVRTDTSYEVVERSAGQVTLAIYGTKARKECRLLGGEAYIHVHDDGASLRGRLLFVAVSLVVPVVATE